MTKDQLELLQEAMDSIAAAWVLLDTGFSGYAASRAYYAMFYIAEAFLEGEGLAFSKHSAVISAFGRRFALAGRVPLEFHKYLIEAQEMRRVADYEIRTQTSPEQAEKQIERAQAFFELAQEMIGKIEPED